MPGAVSTKAAAKVVRSLCKPTVGIVRIDFRSDAGFPVRHLVVRLAVDDALERVPVVAALDRPANAVQRPLLVAGRDDGRPHGMHKASGPLSRETPSALINRLRDPVVVLQVLGDRDASRIPLPHFAIDPLDEAPAVGQVAARIVGCPHVVDVQRHVESQAVDVIFLQPHQGVVADELADFFTAVVGASRAPKASPACQSL